MAKRRPKNEARPSVPAAVTTAVADAEPAWITYGLRIWLAAMLGCTLWVTRPLWTAHADPPLLPAIDTPLTEFDYFGEAIFAAFAAAIVWPRFGWWSYVVVAGAAMLADQTRMQPQMFSFALLMLGTWRSPTAKLLARTHLASLWFFSGVHKLFSPGYYDEVAPWLWGGVMPVAKHPGLADYATAFGAVLALIEVGMGIAVWFPRLRKVVAALALMMHFGIVALLDHLNGWNTSVWGWNCAIALAAFVFVGRWREPLAVDIAHHGRRVCAVVALLFLTPTLFYFGALDAYLCHCLYSANVASAEFHPAGKLYGYRLSWIGEPMNVPLPPAHRLFEAYFRKVAKPGDRLLVHDPRWWAKSTLNGDYQWHYGANGIVREPLAPESAK